MLLAPTRLSGSLAGLAKKGHLLRLRLLFLCKDIAKAEAGFTQVLCQTAGEHRTQSFQTGSLAITDHRGYTGASFVVVVAAAIVMFYFVCVCFLSVPTVAKPLALLCAPEAIFFRPLFLKKHEPP